MRPITGDILLPPNSPTKTVSFVLVEVRDVSEADAPSRVVAEQWLRDVAIKPSGRIHFQLEVPEVEKNRSLALRVHISLHGNVQPQPGDLLSTSRFAVPNREPLVSIEVPVVVI